jgi:uncharacterized protein
VGLHFAKPRRTVRHARLQALTAIAGIALAVLAGRDGSPLWQVTRVAAIAALTVAVIAVLRRTRDAASGRLAFATGAITLTVGMGFLPHLAKTGATLTSITAVVATATGAALAVAGTAVAMRPQRVLGRIGSVAAALVTTVLLAMVTTVSVAATNVPDTETKATPDDVGLEYEDVTLTTRDGERRAAWYVESTNRAAVVLLHGAGSTRSNVLEEAAVLSRNGFGVLMLDARGHGDSDGRAMDFGWWGDTDIAAATTFLAAQPDVDPDRIGAVGMSMGGEEAIGATATNYRIRAVVSEGATGRMAADDGWLSDRFGFRGRLQEQIEKVQDWVTAALTTAPRPKSLRDAVGATATTGTRYLLIAAGKVATETDATQYIRSAAPDRVETWTVEGARHTGGLTTAPDEWERRVIDFLEAALDVG